MARITTVLFDLDGTLIDTEPAAAAAVNECFRSWNLPLSAVDAEYVTGRTWASAFDYLFAKYRLPLARADAETRVLETYRRRLREDLPVVRGGADCVRALVAEYPLGLVSGSHRQEILWALDRLAILSHFRVVLGAEDYPRSKPAPDGYLKAMEMFGARPDETLIFEDSTAGVASALAAGAWVIAIRDTNHFAQDTSGAHAHVADLRGVTPSFVQELAKKW